MNKNCNQLEVVNRRMKHESLNGIFFSYKNGVKVIQR